MSAINAQTFPKSDMIPGVNIIGDKAIEVSANEAGWGGGGGGGGLKDSLHPTSGANSPSGNN